MHEGRTRERPTKTLHQAVDVLETNVAEDDAVLIAPHPCEDIGGAQPRPQPTPHLLEHLVARAVPGGVIDVFEAVEVDEQQQRALVRPLESFDLLRELLLEGRPVRKLGEGIVLRLPTQLLLEQLAFRDVSEGDHRAGARAFDDQRIHRAFDGDHPSARRPEHRGMGGDLKTLLVAAA